MSTVHAVVAPAPAHRGDTRLLAAGDPGPLPDLDAAALLALVGAAGLTGRGGAGFPTARKLAALGARPVVVGNAMEGEHLSRKDATLLRRSPGLVLDGMVLLGRALGASRLVLATGPGVDAGPVSATAAARGVEVMPLAGGFLTGQEQALVAAVDGRPAVPADRWRPVRTAGVGGRPTLVHNVETLAQLALLARYGADWFRGAGLDDDPGTGLVTVTSSSRRAEDAQVLEVSRGTRIVDVLAAAGVPESRTRAVLVGGYHGAWLPADALGTPWSVPALRAYDAHPGAGVLHVLDPGHCPLQVTATVLDHLAEASARQCGPCVNGLPRLASTMRGLARPGAGDLREEIERVSRLVEGRGACSHPDGTVRLTRSTLRVFADHVRAHLDGTCS